MFSLQFVADAVSRSRINWDDFMVFGLLWLITYAIAALGIWLIRKGARRS